MHKLVQLSQNRTLIKTIHRDGFSHSFMALIKPRCTSRIKIGLFRP